MKKRLPLNSPPQSICILRLSAIGDCTHVVPIVRTLQAQWPNTAITWIIGKVEHRLVGDIPGVEFIVFDKSQGKQAYKQLRAQLSGRTFDVLLNLQIALRASLASRYIKAPIKIGYDKSRAKDFQWLFTNQRIPAMPKQHVLDGFFEFLKAMGVQEKRLMWDIPIPDDAKAWIDQHIANNAPLLVINPCTSNRSRNWRNWSAENYAQIAAYAIDQYGMQVALTGGPAEIEVAMAAAIEEHCQHRLINLVGKTQLKELLALLDRAQLMVSPDTGPAHMATTVGTPVIGLFATSNPYRTGPYLSLDYVVNEYPSALKAECGLSVDEAKWGQRVRNEQAMQRIKATDVIEQIDRLMTTEA